jgi:hypothetical protein
MHLPSSTLSTSTSTVPHLIKAKCSSMKSQFLFLLSPHPILRGYAMQANFLGHQHMFAASNLVRRIDCTFTTSTPVHRIDHTSTALTPVHRIDHTSATLTPVHHVEYISAYCRLAQTRLTMLGGFALKICIYSHSG